MKLIYDLLCKLKKEHGYYGGRIEMQLFDKGLCIRCLWVTPDMRSKQFRKEITFDELEHCDIEEVVNIFIGSVIAEI